VTKPISGTICHL